MIGPEVLVIIGIFFVMPLCAALTRVSRMRLEHAHKLKELELQSAQLRLPEAQEMKALAAAKNDLEQRIAVLESIVCADDELEAKFRRLKV